MVTSEKVWMVGRRVQQGFECVDTAPPAFSLMVKKFGNHPSPSFAGGWEEKARGFGNGLTVLRSDQCPYIVDAAENASVSARDGRRLPHGRGPTPATTGSGFRPPRMVCSDSFSTGRC